jgi:hypothetical protein
MKNTYVNCQHATSKTSLWPFEGWPLTGRAAFGHLATPLDSAD